MRSLVSVSVVACLAWSSPIIVQDLAPEIHASFDEFAASRARGILDDTLADYPSARIRNVRAVYYRTPRGRDVLSFCGEVNAKNRVGAYNGWTRFQLGISAGDRLYLETEGTVSQGGLGATVIANSCDRPDAITLDKDYTVFFAPE